MTRASPIPKPHYLPYQAATSSASRCSLCLFHCGHRKSDQAQAVLTAFCAASVADSSVLAGTPPQLYLQGSLWSIVVPCAILCKGFQGRGCLRSVRPAPAKGLVYPGCSREGNFSHRVLAGFELMIFLPQPPKSRNCRHAPPP